ncbi:MAG: hypothetical protein KKB90_03735 [Actinobacteria bacterium]|nr:hypothetical protein [Actinomycetota bacterium]MCG2818435.1 BsuPI-related putative proteinase inhibitor [Actinomycetes bacterium]MBU4218056.1 hypothetical protein [Actinomycetota bacterium]MBU4358519.1 hypothetical protein [Actinomycetota bacterium]MBU4392868.1 hypothetical protein [Actinomycetota bacterium]
MNSHRFNPRIIATSLIIALIALLFSGCGSKQSAKSNSPAPSFSTPDVSVPSEPEVSSPAQPTVTSPEPPEPSPPPPVPEPETEPSPVGPVSGSAEGEGFEVAITADPGEQTTGGEIGLVLVVTNTSGRERAFTLPDTQEYDFVAYDMNGKEAWRWSSDKGFFQVLTDVSFEPDQSRSYPDTWSTPGLSPGDYILKAYFVGLPGVTPLVTITIKSE